MTLLKKYNFMTEIPETYEVIFPSKLNYEFCARTLYFDTRIFCENAVLCNTVLCKPVLCNTVL